MTINLKNKVIFDDVSKEKNGIFQPLVEYCFDLFNEIKGSDYRKKKIESIKESRKAYDQISQPKNFPWKDSSNIVLPLTTITVDNLEPRLVASLVGKKPIVEFDMEGMTEKDEPTEILQDWYNSELEHFVKIKEISRDLVHTILTEGTCYPFPEYSVDETTTRDFVYDEKGQIVFQEDEETGEQTVDAQTIDITDQTSEGVKVNFVEFTDMYVPDNAKNWEETDFIRIVRPTYFELRRREDDLGYQNIGTWLVKDETGRKLSEDQQSPGQQVDDVQVTGKETIECLECHLSYVYRDENEEKEDIKDFTEERIVALIAKDSKILIRLVLLRDLNFKNEHLVKRVRIFPERGRAYGKTMFEKIRSIQEGASDFFNMIMNISTILMIPWFIYSDKAGIESDAELYPGKGVKADDPSAVVFPKFNIQPHQYTEFIDIFFKLWERLGSIGDLQLGRRAESGGGTATEALAVIQEGNIKHNYQGNVFKEEYLSLLRTIYDFYYQKMPLDKTHIFHDKSVQIPRSEMRRLKKFKLTGSTESANKLIERKENEDLYSLLGQNPIANHVKVIEDLVKSYKPDADEKEYVKPEIMQFVVALEENPELPQVVQKYISDKMEISQELEENAGVTTQ